MRKNWSKEHCEECGNEDYASRCESVVYQGPYICCECKEYTKAYNDGYKQALEDKEKGLESKLSCPSENKVSKKSMLEYEISLEHRITVLEYRLNQLTADK